MIYLIIDRFKSHEMFYDRSKNCVLVQTTNLNILGHTKMLSLNG